MYVSYVVSMSTLQKYNFINTILLFFLIIINLLKSCTIVYYQKIKDNNKFKINLPVLNIHSAIHSNINLM